MQIDLIFSIIILVMSVVIHEVSHGYVAEALGDPTARLAGRLTLNPLKHLDLFGSFLVPLLLIFTHSPFVVGWAKPVPYNPYNLKGRYAPAAVAAAGPLANILIAIIFVFVAKFTPFTPVALAIVQINLALALFNLIPIPPIDGSKILFNFLPYKWRALEEWMTRYQWILIFVLLFFGLNFFSYLLGAIYYLLTSIL